MINFFVEYYLFKVFSLFFLSYFDIVYGLYLVIDIAKKKKQTQMIISWAAQVDLNVTFAFSQVTQLALLPGEMKYLSQYLKINNSYVYIQLSNLFLSLTI